MPNFIEIGSRAGEVVLFNKKEKLAVLTPPQAMNLSRIADVLSRAAIAANNARESGPTINEMVDILQAVEMHYKNEAGAKGSWPKLANLERVKNESRSGAYRRITLDAYKTLCQSINMDKSDLDGENPVIFEVDENGIVGKGSLDPAFLLDLDNDDESDPNSLSGDPA